MVTLVSCLRNCLTDVPERGARLARRDDGEYWESPRSPLRQACPERRSSFDGLRMSGVEGLRTNGEYVAVVAKWCAKTASKAQNLLHS